MDYFLAQFHFVFRKATFNVACVTISHDDADVIVICTNRINACSCSWIIGIFLFAQFQFSASSVITLYVRRVPFAFSGFELRSQQSISKHLSRCISCGQHVKNIIESKFCTTSVPIETGDLNSVIYRRSAVLAQDDSGPIWDIGCIVPHATNDIGWEWLRCFVLYSQALIS